jgi:hypothetical protein
MLKQAHLHLVLGHRPFDRVIITVKKTAPFLGSGPQSAKQGDSLSDDLP